MLDKRGISEIVITLVLVLLSLVAVGIVWAVISGILSQGTQQASSGFGGLTLSMNIESVKVMDNGDVQVSVKRNAGTGDLTGINFLVSDGTNSQVVKKATTLQELGTQAFTLTSADLGSVSFVKDVSIAPVITSDSKESAGNVVDKNELSGRILRFTTTHTSGGNAYTFYEINAPNYAISSGDYLQYDVYCNPSNPLCEVGFSMEFSDSTTSRSFNLVDQNGITYVGDQSIYSKGKWYHRKIDLTPVVGKTIHDFNFVENSGAIGGTYISDYSRIVITNGAGAVKQGGVIWNGGNPSVNSVSYNNLASNYGVQVV